MSFSYLRVFFIFDLKNRFKEICKNAAIWEILNENLHSVKNYLLRKGDPHIKIFTNLCECKIRWQSYQIHWTNTR